MSWNQLWLIVGVILTCVAAIACGGNWVNFLWVCQGVSLVTLPFRLILIGSAIYRKWYTPEMAAAAI